MKVLTASRLRRSCSLLRAISLSLSTGDCVEGLCVSMGDFCSRSSEVFKVASVQMLSGESGSSLIGCVWFVSALPGPGKLQGECLN